MDARPAPWLPKSILFNAAGLAVIAGVIAFFARLLSAPVAPNGPGPVSFQRAWSDLIADGNWEGLLARAGDEIRAAPDSPLAWLALAQAMERAEPGLPSHAPTAEAAWDTLLALVRAADEADRRAALARGPTPQPPPVGDALTDADPDVPLDSPDAAPGDASDPYAQDTGPPRFAEPSVAHPVLREWFRGWALAGLGQRDDAVRAWRLAAQRQAARLEAADAHPDDQHLDIRRIRLGRLQALAGETEAAIMTLEPAILRAGDIRPGWLLNMPDLASLQGHPRFRALVMARTTTLGNGARRLLAIGDAESAYWFAAASRARADPVDTQPLFFQALAAERGPEHLRAHAPTLWRDLLAFTEATRPESRPDYRPDAPPIDIEWLHARGYALHRTGQHDEATRVWTTLADSYRLAANPEGALDLYNIACYEALAGRTDAAIAALQNAARVGRRLGADLWDLADPDLDSLRADPRYEAVLTEATQRSPAPAGRAPEGE